jgi:hypothetical protein
VFSWKFQEKAMKDMAFPTATGCCADPSRVRFLSEKADVSRSSKRWGSAATSLGGNFPSQDCLERRYDIVKLDLLDLASSAKF